MDIDGKQKYDKLNWMSRLTPASSSAPHSLSLTPPMSGCGSELGDKRRRLVGWDKITLICKAKATHTGKAILGVNLPLPLCRQVFSYPQESRALSCVVVTWEDKCHHSEPPPHSILFPAVIYAKHDALWYRMFLCSGGNNCPSRVCSLPIFVQPQLTHWWSEVRSRKALDSICKHCSAAPKPSLYYQHCSTTAQVQNTAPYMPLWRKLSYPSQNQHSDVLVITTLLWYNYDKVEHLGKCLKSLECTQMFNILVTTEA